MKYDVNITVGIFHPRIEYQSHLYTYFFILQVLISNVTIVICQYCDGLSDEKKI